MQSYQIETAWKRISHDSKDPSTVIFLVIVIVLNPKLTKMPLLKTIRIIAIQMMLTEIEIAHWSVLIDRLEVHSSDEPKKII